MSARICFTAGSSSLLICSLRQSIMRCLARGTCSSALSELLITSQCVRESLGVYLYWERVACSMSWDCSLPSARTSLDALVPKKRICCSVNLATLTFSRARVPMRRGCTTGASYTCDVRLSVSMIMRVPAAGSSRP